MYDKQLTRLQEALYFRGVNTRIIESTKRAAITADDGNLTVELYTHKRRPQADITIYHASSDGIPVHFQDTLVTHSSIQITRAINRAYAIIFGLVRNVRQAQHALCFKDDAPVKGHATLTTATATFNDPNDIVMLTWDVPVEGKWTLNLNECIIPIAKKDTLPFIPEADAQFCAHLLRRVAEKLGGTFTDPQNLDVPGGEVHTIYGTGVSPEICATTKHRKRFYYFPAQEREAVETVLAKITEFFKENQ